MHGFILVDLRSQIEFLPQQVRNGSQETFLRWLSQHGEVREWTRRGEWAWDRRYYTFYSFRSWWGIEHTFTFPTEGDISIQGKYFHMRTISDAETSDNASSE